MPFLSDGFEGIDPVLWVLGCTSLAALFAALGVLPLIGREKIPRRWMGWANAMAGGMMLGSAYVIAQAGLSGAGREVLPGTLGALAGIGFIYWTHRASGTDEIELNRLNEDRPDYGYQVLLVNTLHSASEGVAIGVAMVIDLRFGAFMALAMAIHNAPEVTVLAAVLRSRGAQLSWAAALGVMTNISQVLFAVVVYAVVSAAPAMLPLVIGFAVGALMHLVLVELLPESYKVAGHTSIALSVSAAMGIVVLLEGVAA